MRGKKIIAMILAVVLCVCAMPAIARAYGKNGWERYEESWRYYKNGEIQYGWLYVGNKWYCAPKNRGGKILLYGYYEIDGKIYYFDEGGAMRTGWVHAKLPCEQSACGYITGWTFHLPSGEAVKGWNKINGKWYYFYDFDEDCKIPWMLDGWDKIDGKWYFFGGPDDGAMKTGWLSDWVYYGEGNVKPAWYYQLPSGESAIGWKKIGGTWYYFKPDYCGAMAESETLEIDGTSYTFASSGAWIK